ncbi:deoxyribonuclease-1-like [Amblyraja radiata]|uniref:deoxyribonuclease-1-like n=1 Tax=Amblyraja radiata TaxID=386614 RepID=UPI0014037E2B|nr:deoxyribonuclease-1-like [Amblyraja radiata]
MRLFLLLCALLCASVSLSLRICSFNVQTFGKAKAAKEEVMETLVKIVSRCDICLLMEVRDCQGKVVPQFISLLNRQDRQGLYTHVASERLGRSSYKEQYVFVYRSDKVRVLAVHQYKAQGSHAFHREPTVVLFSAPNTEVKEFALIPQHTCPGAAEREVDQLYDVAQFVRGLWNTENIMILGDLNAGCRYIRSWGRIRLRTQPGFHWLIGDGADTTVCSSTSCPYDRIIVHGAAFYRAISPRSAKVFDFSRAFGLTEQEALAVSDHFPVEVEVKERQRGRDEL